MRWFSKKFARSDSRTLSKNDLAFQSTLLQASKEDEEDSSQSRQYSRSIHDAEVEALSTKYKLQQLPKDFAGRVLKLEMQMEKGQTYITMDDINNLMDLYTQAVEFYNSTMQSDRQKYYEHKLLNLLESPAVKKVYE